MICLQILNSVFLTANFIANLLSLLQLVSFSHNLKVHSLPLYYYVFDRSTYVDNTVKRS